MSILSEPHFHNEEAAIARLEQIVWPNGPFCPRCGGFDRITTVKGGRAGLRRCGPCRRGAERPSYFTEEVLQRAEKLFERVTNGLGETVIEYGDDLPSLEITPAVAKTAVNNTRLVLTPKAQPYSELGSIEGFAQSIERDGYGRRILHVRYRLNGEIIKCLVSGEAARELENHQIKDIWRNRRVQIYGTLHYRGVGNLRDVEAIRVRFLRDRNELPTVDDILDPNFTGGMKSEDYLARLRDGDS